MDDAIWNEVTATGTPTLYYDHATSTWRDRRTNQPAPPPPDSTFHAVTVDKVLARLVQIVPEMEHVLSAYKDQTVNVFVETLLARTKNAATDEVVSAGRALIKAVLDEKEAEAARGHGWGYTLATKVEVLVTETLRRLVTEEIDRQLKTEAGRLQLLVRDALKSERVEAEVHNLITPKLMDLVKELRLELTAGRKF